MSRIGWIGIGALISDIIGTLYNYSLSLIHIVSLPPLPTTIPIALAVGGFSLIAYNFWDRNRKLSKKVENRIVKKVQREQEQKEIEQIEKGESSDPKRQRENQNRFRPLISDES